MILLSGFAATAALFSSCTNVPDGAGREATADDAQGRATNAKRKMPTSGTPPTTDFVTMTDPVEGMFSMAGPKGWSNRIYSVRVYDYTTMVSTSISPDGSVVMFAGDPSMPQHFKPGNPLVEQLAQWNKMARIEPFVPAEAYFPPYVKAKFGKLPEFKITSVSTDEQAQAELQRKFAERGIPIHGTVARIDFSYAEGGGIRHARIFGTSMDGPTLWTTTVAGISTTGDPDRYKPMMDAIGKTFAMNPAWQARQQERHEQAMAQMRAFSEQMTARHNANMAWIQASAQRHQERMQAIWASNDAQNQAFERRMSAMDTNQRSFLNYIQDENTVQSASGQNFQVATGYDRYFVNKNNHSYVGGDIRFDSDTIRRMGLNPDDYEETKIKR